MKDETKAKWKKFFHVVGRIFAIIGAILKFLLQVIVILLIPVLIIFAAIVSLAKDPSGKSVWKPNLLDYAFLAWLFGHSDD